MQTPPFNIGERVWYAERCTTYSGDEPCEFCGGSGTVQVTAHGETFDVECPECPRPLGYESYGDKTGTGRKRNTFVGYEYRPRLVSIAGVRLNYSREWSFELDNGQSAYLDVLLATEQECIAKCQEKQKAEDNCWFDDAEKERQRKSRRKYAGEKAASGISYWEEQVRRSRKEMEKYQGYLGRAKERARLKAIKKPKESE